MIFLTLVRNLNLLKVVLLVCLTFVYFPASSQVTTWYFGQTAGVQFNGNTAPIANSNSLMNTNEGCATYTDLNSNSIYYSNGEELWIGNNNPIQGFNGSSQATQSAAFMPKPYDSDSIYLFTLDSDVGVGGLCYSIIANNNIVNSKKNIKLLDNLSEKMCLVKHCNNNDAWLIVHGWNNNKFYAFKISAEGIASTPVISNVGSIHNGSLINATGYLKSNHQGNRLGLTIMGSGIVELFHFDNISGTVSNSVTINNLSAPYGLEFNKNSSLLFVSSAAGTINSYSLNSWNSSVISNSEQLVVSGPNLFGALQMGPDDKIYVAQDNSYYIGQISLPENQGVNSLYIESYLFLDGNKCEAGLPPFTNYGSSFTLESTTSCFQDTTFFKIYGDTLNIDSVRWSYGDNMELTTFAGKINTNYTYSYFGLFQTKAVIYHCFEVDTIDLLVQVIEHPIVNLGKDTSFCSNESITFSTIPNIGTTYKWQDGSNSHNFVANKPGIYWLKATSQCGIDTDTVRVLNVWPIPQPSLPNDTMLCMGDSLLLDGGFNNSIWQHSDTNRFFIAKDSGLYHICVYDSNKCVGHDEFRLYVDSLPVSYLGNDTTICIGKSIKLNGGHASHLEWQDYSTGQYYTTYTEGTYSVRLYNLCGSITDSIDITVDDCLIDVYVPNAFSPNGDNANDVFYAIAENINEYSMHIYNRWGHLLFESFDLYTGWEGRDRTGAEVDEATYVYIIRYKDHKGISHSKKGFISLFR